MATEQNARSSEQNARNFEQIARSFENKGPPANLPTPPAELFSPSPVLKGSPAPLFSPRPMLKGPSVTFFSPRSVLTGPPVILFSPRPVLRLILNSSTYQLDARPVAQQSRFAANPDPYFTHTVPRMLSAEQLLDAVTTVTGIAEEFPGYPRGTRAVELAEGAIEHSFLKAFAKPVRDVTCECAREDDPSLGQVIHLLNNRGIVQNIKSPDGRVGRWMAAGKTDDEVLELVYLTTLSRRPTASEQTLIRAHLAGVSDRAAGFHDVQHALLNSNEFLLRH